MNTAQILQNAEQLLAAHTLTVTRPEDNRLDIVIDAVHLREAITQLAEERWGYLATITGLDHLDTDQIEVLYHFCAGAAILTLRISVPRLPIPAVDSICSIIPYASVYERELAEMLGVVVTNTPNTDRLFLADEWPYDVYPLRKDAVLELKQE